MHGPVGFPTRCIFECFGYAGLMDGHQWPSAGFQNGARPMLAVLDVRKTYPKHGDSLGTVSRSGTRPQINRRKSWKTTNILWDPGRKLAAHQNTIPFRHRPETNVAAASLPLPRAVNTRKYSWDICNTPSWEPRPKRAPERHPYHWRTPAAINPRNSPLYSFLVRPAVRGACL